MWQFLDIAYVLPACIAAGYGVAEALKYYYQIEAMVASMIGGFILGVILVGYKIKKYIDSMGKPKTSEEKPE